MITIRERIFWKLYWIVRELQMKWVDLTTPAPVEGEFCGAYLDRVSGGCAGPHGTVVGIDVIAKEAVWRSGRWSSREGDFEAYYDANPRKVRPMPVSSTKG